MLPLTNLAELPALLKFFDSPEGKHLVKDWGISHTSAQFFFFFFSVLATESFAALEEVFHNVSQDSRVGKRRVQKAINWKE